MSKLLTYSDLCGLQLVLIKSTILFTSPERCTAALKDAADANRRLATWVELLQPGVLGRLILFAVEASQAILPAPLGCC